MAVVCRQAEATAQLQQVISRMPVDLDPQLVDEYLAAGITAPVESNGSMSNGSGPGATDDSEPGPLAGQHGTPLPPSSVLHLLRGLVCLA